MFLHRLSRSLGRSCKFTSIFLFNTNSALKNRTS
uniref:Uncharacterized protein n=1 Tax=Podoviridae sp. ct8Lf7 TaxID=2827723 RepID=A0A8S5RZW1_9CAUD|nr:MAG TPA: hypothetical protein [Podoviridae sp. ct8Lf7]